MKCHICKRNINAIGQDNVSHICGIPVCEDCACNLTEEEWKELEKESEKDDG